MFPTYIAEVDLNLKTKKLKFYSPGLRTFVSKRRPQESFIGDCYPLHASMPSDVAISCLFPLVIAHNLLNESTARRFD